MKGLHTRRDFLRYVMVSGVAVPVTGFGLIDRSHASAFNFIADPENPSALEKMHMAKVTLPPVVEDGSAAPVQVELDHPMDDDHYIKSIQIIGFNDPVQTKGIFYLSPANGEAFLSTQVRLNGGESTVWVVTECNQHGRWATSRDTKVAAGGC